MAEIEFWLNLPKTLSDVYAVAINKYDWKGPQNAKTGMNNYNKLKLKNTRIRKWKKHQSMGKGTDTESGQGKNTLT